MYKQNYNLKACQIARTILEILIYLTCNTGLMIIIKKGNIMADRIIIFSGKQYSGKDTLAKILLENMPDFHRCAMGDIIKLEYGRKNNLTARRPRLRHAGGAGPRPEQHLHRPFP